ncbi:MAG TPA: beta-ketoacyl synthase chain length factor [Ramlibacter sp.]|nr:beta-ketoacyl synthase chain length factor [Ramlibacter sp.]
MNELHFVLRSAAVIAPGLPSLAEFRAVARGECAYVHSPLVVPAASALPSQERRRASAAVRLVLACAQDALQAGGVAAEDVESVFATDEGTGEVCQQMLEALATTRMVSPLVFTNSVVNAPSGYFSIAFGNHRSSTVVSLGLESFASGLLCAVTESSVRRRPVLLVSYDPAMTAPMDELLPAREAIANAWVIDCVPDSSRNALATFALALAPREGQVGMASVAGWMPQEWAHHSSARALAALALIDTAHDTSLRFGLGGQSLTLRRTAKVAQ